LFTAESAEHAEWGQPDFIRRRIRRRVSPGCVLVEKGQPLSGVDPIAEALPQAAGLDSPQAKESG
jgi:hypothetical protein